MPLYTLKNIALYYWEKLTCSREELLLRNKALRAQFQALEAVRVLDDESWESELQKLSKLKYPELERASLEFRDRALEKMAKRSGKE